MLCQPLAESICVIFLMSRYFSTCIKFYVKLSLELFCACVNYQEVTYLVKIRKKIFLVEMKVNILCTLLLHLLQN